MSTTSTPIEPTGIEARVCAEIAKRQQIGIKKYGTTLADNTAPRLERLRHAFEEAVDLANYLMWEIVQVEQEVKISEYLRSRNMDGRDLFAGH